MYEPYVKQLLDTMKERQKAQSESPDFHFMFEDFKGNVESARESISKNPSELSKRDIERFCGYLLTSKASLGRLVGQSQKYLIEKESTTLYQELDGELVELIALLAEKVERLQKDGAYWQSKAEGAK